ncbi:hypothetical protein WK28_04490 [Burkholderia vietnamiensis]|nr:hypothetical protein WK28_04490 [Burkholderia vietnamiensis]
MGNYRQHRLEPLFVKPAAPVAQIRILVVQLLACADALLEVAIDLGTVQIPKLLKSADVSLRAESVAAAKRST